MKPCWCIITSNCFLSYCPVGHDETMLVYNNIYCFLSYCPVGHDENMLAVALGYVCHLVAMISNVLDIPLRYPMDHQGSRSAIIDRIIDKLSDDERQ